MSAQTAPSTIAATAPEPAPQVFKGELEFGGEIFDTFSLRQLDVLGGEMLPADCFLIKTQDTSFPFSGMLVTARRVTENRLDCKVDLICAAQGIDRVLATVEKFSLGALELGRSTIYGASEDLVAAAELRDMQAVELSRAVYKIGFVRLRPNSLELDQKLTNCPQENILEHLFNEREDDRLGVWKDLALELYEKSKQLNPSKVECLPQITLRLLV